MTVKSKNSRKGGNVLVPLSFLAAVLASGKTKKKRCKRCKKCKKPRKTKRGGSDSSQKGVDFLNKKSETPKSFSEWQIEKVGPDTGNLARFAGPFKSDDNSCAKGRTQYRQPF